MNQKMVWLSLTVMSGVVLAQTVYRLPPVTHPTQEETRADFLNGGEQLMILKGIPDGDETLVCTNWVCPTSIVVNAQQYIVETNKCLSLTYFKVLTTNDPPVEVASGDIEVEANGKVARCVVFAHRAQASICFSDQAPSVVVQGIGSATNMLFVTYAAYPQDLVQKGYLVYKNFALEVHAPTNAVDFAAAIINAGLPEEERIPLSPTP